MGICYQIIDLGTQDVTFNGEAKKQHKIQVFWELPNSKMDDGRPMMVSKRYTFSSSSNGHLRKDLESWRAKAYTDEEIAGVDITKLLGVPALLTITNEEKNGKTYTNVETVSKLMKGTAVPDRHNPTAYLALDPGQFDQAVFDGLSDFFKDMIRKSPEYQEVIGGAVQQAGGGQQSSEEFLDDNLPF